MRRGLPWGDYFAMHGAMKRSHSPDRSVQKVQDDFFQRLTFGRQMWALFEHLPDVDFFAKDANGRFVAGNAGLLRRLGLSGEDELIGLTDLDIHPARVAREICEDDARVMRTREPLIDRVEALFTRNQAKAWYVTTKLPVFGAGGAVVGIMGFVRQYRRSDVAEEGGARLETAVAHIHAHHAEHITVPELARMTHLSVRQLNRHFREVFGMSPQAFLLRTRVQAASDDLIGTDTSLATIAQDHGFCHQAALSRHFKAHTGETPLNFRRCRQKTTAGGSVADACKNTASSGKTAG